MYKPIITCCLLFYSTISFAFERNTLVSDSTGLPGDYFNLAGALDLFKNASSLEEFEKKLNTEDNYVNNLDLNGDGEVDYIKVNDYMDGNTRAIVIQTPINETESQDIAVIEIEKNGDQSALIQIVGDEELYGTEKMVEPSELTSNTERAKTVNAPAPRVVINVWAWPSVRYMYAPGYVIYRPAWRWRYYPSYWKPWRPRPFNVYHHHPRPFRANYHPVYVRRVVNAPVIYRPHRTTSIVVRNRYHVTVHQHGNRHHLHHHPNRRDKAGQGRNNH
ncbi:MAG: hypothetical protein V4714_13515, partial [Bacteroidota bacterium]